MNKFRGLKNLCLFGLLVVLSACAQSRRSLLAGQNTDQLWEPVVLSANEANNGASLYNNAYSNTSNLGNYGALGSFELQPNISRNSAYLYVSNLGFNPSEIPYRVLARRTGESQFLLLKDMVTVSSGGEIEVFAKSGHRIEDYETWRIELVINYDAQNFQVQAPAGQGLPIVQQTVDYPELYTSTGSTLNR